MHAELCGVWLLMYACAFILDLDSLARTPQMQTYTYTHEFLNAHRAPRVWFLMHACAFILDLGSLVRTPQMQVQDSRMQFFIGLTYRFFSYIPGQSTELLTRIRWMSLHDGWLEKFTPKQTNWTLVSLLKKYQWKLIQCTQFHVGNIFDQYLLQANLDIAWNRKKCWAH